jgi:hypothetical protein
LATSGFWVAAALREGCVGGAPATWVREGPARADSFCFPVAAIGG